MAIPYRTRRRLQRLGSIGLALLVLFVLSWLCWVIWVERHIIYTRDGATLDFSLSAEIPSGQVAMPPAVGEGPEIHYNEGENAVNTSTELQQLKGYYITYEMMVEDMAKVQELVGKLPTNTPVMIDMKGGYGSFYYSSDLADAVISSSVNVQAVDSLIELMLSKNLYPIARISAFQDYSYALKHVTTGIPFTGGGGALWMDTEGYYWLKPTDSGVLGYISSVVLELRGRGFKEVVLDDFNVPESQRVVYSTDRITDLTAAANTLAKNCATNTFTLSFTVPSASFTLPEGRCRMYLSNVPARDVEITAAQTTVTDPEIRMVFIADSNDTRFDKYGVFRSLEMLEEETTE